MKNTHHITVKSSLRDSVRTACRSSVQRGALLDTVWHNGDNILLSSEVYDAYFDKHGITVTNEATPLAPDGSTSVSKVSEGFDTWEFTFGKEPLAITNGYYALYVKYNSARYFYLRAIQGFRNWVAVLFDIQAGVIVGTTHGEESTFTNIDSAIAARGNGWYYCSLEYNGNEADKSLFVSFSNASNPSYYPDWGQVHYSGDGNYSYFWNIFARER